MPPDRCTITPEQIISPAAATDDDATRPRRAKPATRAATATRPVSAHACRNELPRYIPYSGIAATCTQRSTITTRCRVSHADAGRDPPRGSQAGHRPRFRSGEKGTHPYRHRRQGPESELLDPPRAAVRRQQVEERDGVEGLGAEDAGALPGAAREQLQRHDRVDRRLPDDALVAVLLHRPLVVDHVVEVRRARRAVLARAGDPEARAGLALHPRADRRRVGQHRGDDVARRHLDPLDPHLLGAVEAEGVQHLEDVDELVTEAVLERRALAV